MEIGTQEYYRTTVLQGFFDDNDRITKLEN